MYSNMEQKKITVTAIGKNKLDILNRITSLYLQKNIPVESFMLSQADNGDSKYQICVNTSEDAIVRIVNQMNNIIDLKSVQYTINHKTA